MNQPPLVLEMLARERIDRFRREAEIARRSRVVADIARRNRVPRKDRVRRPILRRRASAAC
jgi:hypothetical protein